MAGKRILILGYGNPGRGDDGLGPAAVEKLESLALPGVTLDADYQLNIEDAAVMAEHDVVLFIDAGVDVRPPFTLRRVSSAPAIEFTSHSVSAESLLAICEDNFSASPEAWMMGIRGYDFEFDESLSPEARENLDKAVEFIPSLVKRWKEQNMESTNSSKKTVLIIDDDADIRSSIRLVLEAEGYAVGEASTGEEGLKVAERIEPDAVIVDLMMETVDSGAVLAKKLKDLGSTGPIWMLSSAGDSVSYNLDPRELGLSGIFQKPVDPKTLLSTLKAKLGAP